MNLFSISILFVQDKPIGDAQLLNLFQPILCIGALAEGPCLYPVKLLLIQLGFKGRRRDPFLFQVSDPVRSVELLSRGNAGRKPWLVPVTFDVRTRN